MTRSFISMIEAGKKQPSRETLRLLASRLGVAEGDLLVDDPVVPKWTYEWDLLCAAQRHLEGGNFHCARSLCIQLLEQSTDVEVMARASRLLIHCLCQLYRVTDASLACKNALTDLSSPCDASTTQLYWDTAQVAYANDDFTSALHFYQQVKVRCQPYKGPFAGYAGATLYIGSCLFRMGKLAQAVQSYEEALRAWRGLGDVRQQAWCSLGLSAAHAKLGVLDQALRWAQTARDLWISVASDEAVLAIHNLAVVQTRMGNHDQVYPLLIECYEHYRRQQRMDKLASLLDDLAEYWLAMDDLEAAQECCWRAMALVIRSNSIILTAKINRHLGAISHRRGDSRAAHYLHVSHLLFRQIGVEDEAEISARLLNKAMETVDPWSDLALTEESPSSSAPSSPYPCMDTGIWEKDFHPFVSN